MTADSSIGKKRASTADKTIVTIDAESDAIKQIRTAPASVKLHPFIVEATGQLQPNANAVTRVSAPVSGKVTEVLASVGEVVKPGQVMATINSQEIGALVTDLFKVETDIDSELSRDLLDIDCELEQEQAELLLSQKQYDRAELLVQEKIASLAELERARTVLEKHKLTIAALKKKKTRTEAVSSERKRMAYISLEQKLTVLGMPSSTISSIMKQRSVVSAIPIQTPQGGFVLERNVNLGELVDPSDVLFVVDDIDNLWLVADIFEQDVKHVQAGQSIEFSVDSFPTERFTGELNFVAGTINPETRTLAVRAVIANHDFRLKPKMFARMKIKAGDQKVLAIPKSAVQDAGSEKVVYVRLSETTFEERTVHLGQDSADYVQILDGIKPGEIIVVEGSFSLRSQALKQEH